MSIAAFQQAITAETVSYATESHPGMMAEADYSEAVLDFNGKNYPETIKILDKLLSVAPQHVEALELKALTLKTMGNTTGSSEVYKKLLEIKPENERAPYEFELGMILFQDKKGAEAKPHFEAASEGKFNVGPSNFFLGNIAYGMGDFSSADRYFSKAIDWSSGELRVASHYYLGLIHFQNGYGSGATHELVAAINEAKKLPDSKVAQDIFKAATQALKPYDSAQWFANFSLVNQYDGNVSLISNLASQTQDQTSGKSTLKTNIAAGVGRMSSPMKTLQWIGSYRFTINKNYDSATEDYEFLTNTFSLYLTMDPLAQANSGFKVEVNHTMQNQADLITGSRAYHPYSLSAEIGPYYRRELMRKLNLSIEAFLKPQSYGTETPGPTERAGNAYLGRVTLRKETAQRFWNPEFALSYEVNNSKGADYQSNTITVSLTDVVKLPGSSVLQAGVDYLHASYPNRTVASRTDSTYTARASWIKELTQKWSLVTDASYTINNSSVEELYSYKKPILSLGVSCSL